MAVLDDALGIFAVSLLCYHVSELALVMYFEPEELSFSSLLLSPPYLGAMALGLVEYHMELHYVAQAKHVITSWTRLPAVVLLCAGELLRKAAWVTARASFTHRIKVYKRPQHELVTGGVYALCRHPGYLGWMLWALATQLLLANPGCLVVFAALIWRFFSVRIAVEEYHLRRIFGEPYMAYRRRTPTYMPGIP